MLTEKPLELLKNFSSASFFTARRSNQSILKEINPEYSLQGLMLQLKLQYFGHLIWRVDSLTNTRHWERLKAKGERGGRGWDGYIASASQWTWIWAHFRRQWRTGEPGVLQLMESRRVRHDLSTEQQQPQHLKGSRYMICILSLLGVWVWEKEIPSNTMQGQTRIRSSLGKKGWQKPGRDTF